jgi:hypothetical protein
MVAYRGVLLVGSAAATSVVEEGIDGADFLNVRLPCTRYWGLLPKLALVLAR